MWLIPLLFLVALCAIRFIDHRGFAYGNLGFLWLNKAMSSENSQAKPDLIRAQNLLKSATADSPSNANYLFALGRMSLLQGNEELAGYFWGKIDPRQSVTRLILWGDQYKDLGEHNNAMLWYQRASHIGNDSADPWQRIGLIYEVQGRFADAEDAYENGLSKSVAYNVGRSDFYFRLGQLNSKKQGYKDWPIVLDLIEQALSQERLL